MSSRCASCSYPLSVCDSVVCYECSSYFHIDCAQLVGFPGYELSRNTFHCTTCELLPLPTRQFDSDSDSDCDSGMPSRQLDYHLETQGDFSKDMNEIKGNVQDLSNLCKDMLREINEIKSINLTLRCCVENLRHENDERDKIISQLKLRLESLEGNRQIKKERENSDDITVEPGLGESYNLDIRPLDSNIKMCVSSEHQQKDDICKPQEIKENRQDWTWRERTAIELKEEKEDDDDEESTEEGDETQESDLEVQSWEILSKEIESQRTLNQDVDLDPTENSESNDRQPVDKKVLSEDKFEYDTHDHTTHHSEKDQMETEPINSVNERNEEETEQELESEAESPIHELTSLSNEKDQSENEPINSVNERNEEETEQELELEAESPIHELTSHSNEKGQTKTDPINSVNEHNEGETERELESEAESPIHELTSLSNEKDQSETELINSVNELNEEETEQDLESEAEPPIHELTSLSNENYQTETEPTKSLYEPDEEETKKELESEDETPLHEHTFIATEKGQTESMSRKHLKEPNEEETEKDLEPEAFLNDELTSLFDDLPVHEASFQDEENTIKIEDEETVRDLIECEKENIENGVLLSEEICEEKAEESIVKEIRHEDFTEVEVGEIPEEGEDDDSLHEEEDGNNEEPLENLEISYEAGESADPIVESNPLGESETCTDGDLRLDEQLAAELQGDREDRPESEHRLQGEPEILISEGALEVEGEQRLGGQSPEEEVQPSEHSEPSHPQHTEEDLWHYLKEAVTSERPSTVEEFLQNLIGTLQHVPEEYLEPVVAANIKRSNSPCSTDGDNQRFSGEMVAEQKETVNLEGDSSSKSESTAMPEDVTTPVEVVTPDVPAEVPNTETNATSDSEGLSSVEAAV